LTRDPRRGTREASRLASPVSRLGLSAITVLAALLTLVIPAVGMAQSPDSLPAGLVERAVTVGPMKLPGMWCSSYFSCHSTPLIAKNAKPKIKVKISIQISSLRFPICAARTASTTVRLLQSRTAVLIAPNGTAMLLLEAANDSK